MLENATVHRLEAPNGGGFDLGALLDCGLYYGRVHLLLDDFELVDFINAAGIEGLIALASTSTFDVSIAIQAVGISSTTIAGREVYAPRAFHIQPPNSPRSDKDPTGALFHHLNLPGREPLASASQVDRLIAAVSVFHFPEFLGVEYDSCELWRSIVEDPDAVRAAIPIAAAARGLSVNKDVLRTARFVSFKRDLPTGGQGCVFWSDVEPRQLVPPADGQEFTWSDPLGVVEKYRTAMVLSERFGGDFITGPVATDFTTGRVSVALERGSESQEKIDVFQDVVFKGGRSIGQAVASGLLDLSEALALIDESSKFKSWVHGLDADANLARSYFEEVSRKNVLERFPGREIRFLGITAAGAALGGLVAGPPGMLAGAGLGAFDTYLLGRFVKGWRPNEFVDRVVRAIGNSE